MRPLRSQRFHFLSLNTQCARPPAFALSEKADTINNFFSSASILPSLALAFRPSPVTGRCRVAFLSTSQATLPPWSRICRTNLKPGGYKSKFWLGPFQENINLSYQLLLALSNNYTWHCTSCATTNCRSSYHSCIRSGTSERNITLTPMFCKNAQKNRRFGIDLDCNAGRRGCASRDRLGTPHYWSARSLCSRFYSVISPCLGVHCLRLFSSPMEASTQDTYKQLADETCKYVRSQQLGACIDGHWITHDADPSRFPQNLLQLLQHPQRVHPHEHVSERSLTRQEFVAQSPPGTQHTTGEEQHKSVPLSTLAFTSFEVRDPATGETACLLPALDSTYVRAAVAAAGRAQHAVWGERQAPPARRHHVLKEWERLVKAEKEFLARVLVLETGKPLPEARSEILYASSFIEWFAEQLRRDNGITIPSPSGTHVLMTAYRQPVGVCALITPWNMPAAMLTRKAAAALAAGCCCVCKLPAEAPLTALCMGRLAERAGVPPGALNMITTDHKGARLFAEEVCRQPLVRKISFTGSTRVGKLLMQQAALTMKRISLELGGNAPFIVFEDAEVDEAVQALVACKFRNAGQTCVCANRVYIHRNIWNKFVPPLVKLISELVVGHGFVHGVSIGPLINKGACEKVERLVVQALALGGRLLCPVDAGTSGAAHKDSQGGGAAAFRAAEQLVRGVRNSLPQHLRATSESSFFPPVVMDCRAFDGLELETMRHVIQKDLRAATTGVAGVERPLKRESTGGLQHSPSRSEQQHHGEEGQVRLEKQEEQYPEMLQVELFGPVLPLYSFSDEADVVRRANATKAGLAAYVCTRDLYRLSRITEAIEAGMVAVNTGLLSAAEAPFGGIKESGMGREGSVYGLDEYTELKYVCIGGGPAMK